MEQLRQKPHGETEKSPERDRETTYLEASERLKEAEEELELARIRLNDAKIERIRTSKELKIGGPAPKIIREAFDAAKAELEAAKQYNKAARENMEKLKLYADALEKSLEN